MLFLVGATLPLGSLHLFSIGIFHVTLFKLLTTILLAVAVTQYVTVGGGLPRNRKNLLVLLFFASYTLSSVMGLAVDVPPKFIFVRFTTFLALVIYYFLLTYVVTTMRDVRVVLWSIVVGGGLTVFPIVLGIDTGTETKTGTRYVGLAGQSNRMGYDMAVALPLAMALFFGSRRFLAKTLATTLAVLAAMGITLSLSRSAFVGTAGMWGLWMIRSRRIDSIKYLIPALIGVAVFALVMPEDVIKRAQTVTDESQRSEDYSIQSRIFVYRLGLKAFVTHPIVGLGNFGWFIWAYDQPLGGHDVGHIHSVYIAVLAYQGLVGAIPFFGFMIITWRDYNRTRRAAYHYRNRRDPELMEMGHYAMFLQIAFFGNLLGNIFSTAFDAKSQWLVIAFSTVMLVLARKRVAALEAEQPSGDLESDTLSPGYDYGPRPDDAYAR